MKKDCNKWKAKKGKGKDNEPEEKKKSSVKIEEINVTENVSQDSDACKTISTEIYFTSNMDSIFLTASDGYALSDWILDSGHHFMYLRTESGLRHMWPLKIM